MSFGRGVNFLDDALATILGQAYVEDEALFTSFVRLSGNLISVFAIFMLIPTLKGHFVIIVPLQAGPARVKDFA